MRKLLVLVAFTTILMSLGPVANAGCLIECTETPELPGQDDTAPDDDPVTTDPDEPDADDAEGDQETDPADEPATTSPGAHFSDLGDAAARLVSLANDERARRGLPDLTVRADVTDIAHGHSRAQAERGTIWHNDAYFSDSMKDRLGARTVGENVAMNSSVDDAHRRLMASAGHRANILSGSFSVVGVAVVRSSSGTLYITQNFVEPTRSGSVAAAGAKRASDGTLTAAGETRSAAAGGDAGTETGFDTAAAGGAELHRLRFESGRGASARIAGQVPGNPAAPSLAGPGVVAVLGLCAAAVALVRRLPNQRRRTEAARPALVALPVA